MSVDRTPPVVSVVIPTYNHRAFVLDTLGSVFAQTFTDYEVIVVNDGSPDDTAEVLRPLADAGRIRYFEQPNAGQAAARNRGIAEARGEFVALLDDDDVWPADKLAWQVEVLRRAPHVAVAYGFTGYFGRYESSATPERPGPSGDVFAALVEAGWIRSPGQTLIRKSAINRVGGFDPDIWGTADWDLWLRLAQAGEFQYQPRLALRYRLHSANASHDFRRMYSNAKKVIEKHFDRKRHPERARLRATAAAFVRGFCAFDGSRVAIAQGVNGQWAEARRTWGAVLRIRPATIQYRYTWRSLLRAHTPEACVRLLHAFR